MRRGAAKLASQRFDGPSESITILLTTPSKKCCSHPRLRFIKFTRLPHASLSFGKNEVVRSRVDVADQNTMSKSDIRLSGPIRNVIFFVTLGLK